MADAVRGYFKVPTDCNRSLRPVLKLHVPFHKPATMNLQLEDTRPRPSLLLLDNF